MQRHRAVVLLPFALALAFAVPAGADTVTLANGDRLTGKVVDQTQDSVTLETAYAGKVRIRREEIAVLEATAAPSASAQRERVRYQGRVTLSAANVRGNSSSSRVQGDAEFTARAKPYRYALGFKGARASDSGVETASSALATGNYDRFVAQDRFVYGRASVERDRFRGIARRAAAGGGYGWQLRDTDRTQLSVRGGLDLVSLDRTDGTNNSHPALGWGLRFSHRLWDERVELFHDQDGFWNLVDTERVTLRSKTGLRVPIAAGLSASAQLNADWESEPAPGRRSTDTTFLVGLGYEW